MENNTETDSERELELDSRKLTYIFFGFLAICGCFFVVGYVLGNGSASSSPSVNYADTGTAVIIKDDPGIEAYNRMNEIVIEPVTPPSAVTESQTAKPEISIPAAAVPAAAAPDTIVSVQPASVDNKKPQPKETPNNAAKPTAAAEKAPAPAKQAASANSGFSVQVAAFRALREAAIVATDLESKGFDHRIEPPPTPGDYFRVKVGRFATRAQAVEMAARLKERGFETMITEIKGN